MTSRLAVPLTFVLVACIADWALTIDAVAAGWAYEASPIMAAALDLGTAASFVVKVGITAACCAGLWALRERRLVRISAWGLAGVYAALLVYQLVPRFAL